MRLCALFLLGTLLLGQPDESRVAEARRLFSGGQFAESADVWKRIVSESPGNVDALLGYGVALDALGRYSEAYQFLEKAQALEKAHGYRPSSTPVLNNLAVTLVHLGRVKEALTAFDRSLQLQPNNVSALFNSGALLLAEHRWAESIDRLTKAAGLSASDEGIRAKLAEAHREAGESLLRSGNLQASLPEFQSAIELDSNDESAYLGAALALIRGNASAKAVSVLQEANRHLPGRPKILVALGYAYGSDGQWADAAAWYRQAVAVEPCSAVARVMLGRSLRQEGDEQKGLAELRAAVRCAPQSPLACFELGRALIEADPASGEGIDLLRRTAELDPHSAEPKYMLAKAAFSRNRLAEAEHFAQLATTTDPGMPSAHYLLSQVLRQEGKVDKADVELAEFRRLKQAAATRENQELETVLAR